MICGRRGRRKSTRGWSNMQTNLNRMDGRTDARPYHACIRPGMNNIQLLVIHILMKYGNASSTTPAVTSNRVPLIKYGTIIRPSPDRKGTIFFCFLPYMK